MAITANHLATAGDGTDANSYTTASITPGANRLVLAAIYNDDSGTPATPTLSGNGLTWVQVATVTFSTIASPTMRLTLFRALGASPSAGAVTITATGSNSCMWSIAEFDGVDTGGTNGSAAVVQSATNRVDGGTGLTVTLAAFGDAVNNAAYGGFSVEGGGTGVTPGSGFTELGEVLVEGSRIQSEWKLGEDTSVDASALGTNDWGGIAVEIKAAAAAAARRGLLLRGVGG